MVPTAAVLLEGMLHGFQDVHLASELVGITEPSVYIKSDGLRRRDQGLGLAHLRNQENQLGQDIAPAMQPDIQSATLGRPVFRDDQPVRLDGAVDLRAIATHDLTSRRLPWRLTRLQVGQALVAHLQEVLGVGQLLDVVDFVQFDRPKDGLGEDFHVRDIVGDVLGQHARLLERLDLGLKLTTTGQELRLVLLRERDARRRTLRILILRRECRGQH